MAKNKRNTKSQQVPMEKIMVYDGDQNLVASGALVDGTTSLNIANQQLGVLSWDFDGTVALGNFIPAATTAANVTAVKVIQGTPKSSAIHEADPWGVSDPAYVESDIIYRDNIVSVSTALYRTPVRGAVSVTDFPTTAVSSEYGMYVILNSTRNDRDYGDNDEVVFEAIPTPASLAAYNDATDYVLQNLAYSLNHHSKVASLSNAAGVRRGNKNFIVLAVNSAGGNGQAIGTITCASTPTTFPVMYSYDAEGNRITTNITADASIVAALAQHIVDQAADAADVTDQLTAASTIEVIDPLNAGEGTAATGTLTTTGNFTANDEVTIGSITYTFVASPSSAYDVDLGASAAISLSNLAAAINGTGTAGTEYAAGTLPNASVSAVATATTLVVTAKAGGTAGNSVVFTEDTDGGTTWSVSGSGTLAGGANTNVDGLIVLSVPSTPAAYVDTIEQVQTAVRVNLSDDWEAAGIYANTTYPKEGTGQGRKWVIQNDDRYQLTKHTAQYVPYGEFFSKGYDYISPDLNYTSTIIEYMDYEDTISGRRSNAKKLILLGTASATCTTVSTAASNLGSGPAITTATDDTTTVSDLNDILGAWLLNARTYSAFDIKGDATSSALFA
jgi:hypothetical protein